MGVRSSPLPPREPIWFNRMEGCDAGSFNGRTRVFEARYERSIRSPAARSYFELKVRGVVKATVTSLSKKTLYLIVPSSWVSKR
jgi:hypothetical protein